MEPPRNLLRVMARSQTGARNRSSCTPGRLSTLLMGTAVPARIQTTVGGCNGWSRSGERTTGIRLCTGRHVEFAVVVTTAQMCPFSPRPRR